MLFRSGTVRGQLTINTGSNLPALPFNQCVRGPLLLHLHLTCPTLLNLSQECLAARCCVSVFHPSLKFNNLLMTSLYLDFFPPHFSSPLLFPPLPSPLPSSPFLLSPPLPSSPPKLYFTLPPLLLPSPLLSSFLLSEAGCKATLRAPCLLGWSYLHRGQDRKSVV